VCLRRACYHEQAGGAPVEAMDDPRATRILPSVLFVGGLIGALTAGGGVGARLQLGRGGFFGFDLGWSPDAGLTFTTAVSLAY
jgi:hypothetical protein